MRGCCCCLQVPVGTGLILMEWGQYVTPCIRRSKVLTALWFGACFTAMSPLFVLYGALVLLPEWLTAKYGGRGGDGLGDGGDALELTGLGPGAGAGAGQAAAVVMRVASYNLQSCVGSDVQRDVKRTARAIKKLGTEDAPLQLCALQEVEQAQFVQLQELTGMPHGVFHATREKEKYGIAVLSSLPVVEHSVLRFQKWWRRGQRACLFVKVAIPQRNKGAFLWFATAHLQNDLTGLENSIQLGKIVAHLPKLVQDGSASPTHCVVGMDSNLPAFRMGPITRQLGLHDATLSVQSKPVITGGHRKKKSHKVCYIEHPPTFPSGSPSVKLDALLYTATAAKKGGARVVVSTADAKLSKTASFDEVSGHHASDHRPVAGRVVVPSLFVSTSGVFVS